MLTEIQRAVFNDILNTNWELKELQAAGKWAEAGDKSKEYIFHIYKLKESMGNKDYENFMKMGSKMFSPNCN